MCASHAHMEVCKAAGPLALYFWILQGRTHYRSMYCINTSAKGYKNMQQWCFVWNGNPVVSIKPQTALPGREPSISWTPPWTDSYGSSPLCPTTACLSISTPTSAAFLSLLRMGLELFRKSEYTATLLLIYLFICPERFLFWVCSKAGALPDLAGIQR